jgi:hypothetical protein
MQPSHEAIVFRWPGLAVTRPLPSNSVLSYPGGRQLAIARYASQQCEIRGWGPGTESITYDVIGGEKNAFLIKFEYLFVLAQR